MFFSKKVSVAAGACLLVSTATALPMIFFTPAIQAQSRVRYVPPSNLGAPIVSIPGITRSAGCAESGCLIGLVPDLQAETAPVPQTISERPTIYFLTPKVDGIAYFRLFESDKSLTKGKRIYRTSFAIKEQAGILAFKLPDNAPKLEAGKNYVWEFTVGSLTDSESIRGSIRRILPSPKLVIQLAKTLQPLDRAALLAQESIWFDTLQILAEEKRSADQKDTEVINEWTSLLKSANLDRVLTYSFIKTK
jgi:hypothetical protein